jgi:hypothetical protein
MKKRFGKKLLRNLLSILLAFIVSTSCITPSNAIPSGIDQDIIKFYAIVGDLDILTRDYIISQIANTSTFELNSTLDTNIAANAIAIRINDPEITEEFIKTALDKIVLFRGLNSTNSLILKESMRLFYGPLIEATAPTGADNVLAKIYNYTFTYKLFVNAINYVKSSVNNTGIFAGIPLYRPYGTMNIMIDPVLSEIIDIYINSFPTTTPELLALKTKIQSYLTYILNLINKFNESLVEEKSIVINDLAYNYGGLVRIEEPLDLPPTLNPDLTAIGTATKEALADAFSEATPVNNKQTVKLNLIPVTNAKAYAVNIPSSYLSSGNKNKLLEVVTPKGSVLLSGSMFKSSDVPANSTIQIVIDIVKASTLGNISSDTKAKIGNRPVVNVNAYVNGNKVAWNNPDSPVTVSIPYTPTAYELENKGFIVVWYVDGQGKIHSVPNGVYNSVTGFVTFSTTHFTNYAVVFLVKTFKDSNLYPWEKKPIETLYSKGIINDSKTGKFYPTYKIARGEFVSYVVRALGLSAKVTKNFADVKTSHTFYKEIGIARKLGIVLGKGKNMYYPQSGISRQDMMVISVRAMIYAGKLSADEITSKIDGKFADKKKVSSYAVLSVATLIKTGIIMGSGNKINPLSNVTKAQAAVTVYRMMNK